MHGIPNRWFPGFRISAAAAFSPSFFLFCLCTDIETRLFGLAPSSFFEQRAVSDFAQRLGRTTVVAFLSRRRHPSKWETEKLDRHSQLFDNLLSPSIPKYAYSRKVAYCVLFVRDGARVVLL